jgi:hypothetical protein
MFDIKLSKKKKGRKKFKVQSSKFFEPGTRNPEPGIRNDCMIQGTPPCGVNSVTQFRAAEA